MRLLLDVFLQQVPGEEAQAELALAGADVEEVDGVEDLGFGDVDVDGAEVLGEAVPDEDAAEVKEEPELLVGDFQRNQVVRGVEAVEVAFVHAGPFGEIVDDRLGDGDVVVDEREAFINAAAAEDGNTSEAEARRTDDFAVTVGFDLDLFLL